MKKLLPIILAVVGLGIGVGAGVFLKPAPEVEADMASGDMAHDGEDAPMDMAHDMPKDEGHGAGMAMMLSLIHI